MLLPVVAEWDGMDPIPIPIPSPNHNPMLLVCQRVGDSARRCVVPVCGVGWSIAGWHLPEWPQLTWMRELWESGECSSIMYPQLCILISLNRNLFVDLRGLPAQNRPRQQPNWQTYRNALAKIIRQFLHKSTASNVFSIY